MRVLVTGGTGYLGRVIVRQLHAAGDVPVVYARRAAGSGLPGELVNGDIRDRDTLVRIVRGVDGIIHAAALVSMWRPRAAQFEDVNIGGLQNVLGAALEARVGRIVYTSSFLALPPHGHASPLAANDYQRTKAAALQVARQFATQQPIAILFPGVVYGPGIFTEGNLVGRLIADHLQGRLPGLIGPERCWSYAYVEDVAAAHVTAIHSGVSGEFVLGGENAPQRRVFEILRDERGVSLPRRIPVSVALLAATFEEARARIFGHAPRVTRGAVKILRCDWPLDSARSVRELSYHIRSLKDGIGRTLESLA